MPGLSISAMTCSVRKLWSDHAVGFLLVPGLARFSQSPPLFPTWVVVSSTERSWKRLKAGRPRRPGHYVSHQDKVVRIWAVKIMSSPQGKRSRGDGLAQSGTSGVIGSKGLYWAESTGSEWEAEQWERLNWWTKEEITKESPKCWKKRHVSYGN